MTFIRNNLHHVQGDQGFNSPGHLPDTLAVEQIRSGRSSRRNQVLAEHAAHILPYRGLGTGIPRALGAWPKIDLLDERELMGDLLRFGVDVEVIAPPDLRSRIKRALHEAAGKYL